MVLSIFFKLSGVVFARTGSASLFAISVSIIPTLLHSNLHSGAPAGKQGLSESGLTVFPASCYVPRVLSSYELVELKNGMFSIRSTAVGETFHPVIGPRAEAEALYVRQLSLVERLKNCPEEFVVWDIGLGAAANPLAFIAAAQAVPGKLRIVSFDHTKEPLRFALQHPERLGYLEGYTDFLERLHREHNVTFCCLEGLNVTWQLHVADFPTLVRSSEMKILPAPHAIFFDAFSPQKNPAMWTLPLFRDIFALLQPSRPCVMPTYSRSTMLRVTLLLAGFYVGVGHATGEKEETTVAASSLDLIDQPLDSRWLLKARRSRSAEPLGGPHYRQAPLSPESFDQLMQHAQFR